MEIGFAILEQLIINSLESRYFTGLVPGDAMKGKTLLPGFSLVNCRLFSRALAQELCGSTGGDEMAILGLLNDMRPSMLELDTGWTDLLRKYPKAGVEPSIDIQNLSEETIKNAIINNLLASDEDINNFMTELNTKATVTGWNISGHCHVSIFEEEGLDTASALVKKMMEDVKNSVRTEKFTLFDPIKELF